MSAPRAGAVVIAVAVVIALVVAWCASGTGLARAASSAAPVPSPGVTKHTITVAGILAGDAATQGADVGARARFARANAHGGVGGRTVEYLTTESDSGDAARDAASIERLRSQVFAVVPAASPALDTGALARARLPFFGAADGAAWNGNAYGFGFAGAQAPVRTRVVSPAWGLLLRALLGDSRGRRVALVADADTAGAVRAVQARTSLQAAGFRVVPGIAVAALPLPLPADLTADVGNLATAGPDASVLLTSPPTTSALASGLAAAGYTGTIATGAAFYQPTIPAVAGGLTVLLPYAPPEQLTAANRRLLADVEATAPGTAVTPGVISGYWAADLFLAALAAAGKQPSAARLVHALDRGFTYRVAGTVGPTTFPAAHNTPSPCGALLQGDGIRYLVAVSYRCGAPVVVKRTRAGGSGR